MLVLLPPSEGKAVGTGARPLDMDDLSFTALNPTRVEVLDALVTASSRDDALSVLDAPKGAADQVDRNRDLRTAPTLRVSDLYTGVLYDALDHRTLSATAKRRATRRLVVVDALFGALGFGDRAPSYRLSMGVDLPGVGKLAATWRAPLATVLPSAAGRGVIVDLRSSGYVAAWRPEGDLAERTVAVHVVRDGASGRSVVSHMAKHTRGLVARHLMETGVDPRTPDELADTLGSRFEVSLEAGSAGRVRRLEIVEPG